MTLAEIHDADMASIIAEAGNTFTWSGADYPCIVADNVRTKELEEGGFQPGYDFSVSTRASLFGDTLPDVGQQVTIDSTAYRIMRRRKNFTGKLLVLDLMVVSK